MKKLRIRPDIEIMNDKGADAMMQETLNLKLYQKMLAEQTDFKRWLIRLPLEEILNHAYEYIIREKILLAVEFNNLIVDQVKTMFWLPTHLADIYAKWKSWETNCMENIRQAVSSRAGDVIKMQSVYAREKER